MNNKAKLVKIYYYNNDSSPIIVCDICGYSLKSETGMRLHRKKSHNILSNFKKSVNVSYVCNGCKKLNSRCVCSK